MLIIRLQRKIDIDIFRKPTTDITIHSTSNHPLEHKLAAYRYYLYRLNTFPLTEDNQKKESNNIKHIAKMNGYSGKTIEKLNWKIKQNLNKENKENETMDTQQKEG